MLSLYFRLIGARIRAQMQYKASFMLELVGFALTTGLEFVVIVFLFTHFPAIHGWGVEEVALLYGLSSTSLGLAEMVGRGFDAPFERMIQQGSFDIVLIRPLGSFFQVLASEFQLRRTGRSFQGLLVLGYALSHLTIAWTLAKLLLLPLTLISGTLIYMGLFIIGATLCFWTVKTPEVVNIFTFGGDAMVSYPITIYQKWLRDVFLFVVPVAFVNYPAALKLLNRIEPNGVPPELAWAAPLVATLFFLVARGFWQIGVSKYTSTGS